MARKRNKVKNQVDGMQELLSGTQEEQLEKIEARIKELTEWSNAQTVDGIEPKEYAKSTPKYQSTAPWKKYFLLLGEKSNEINKLNNLRKVNKVYLERQVVNAYEKAAIDVDFLREAITTKFYLQLHGKIVKPKKLTKPMLDNITIQDFKSYQSMLKALADTQINMKNVSTKGDIKEVEKSKGKIEDILGFGSKEKVSKKDAFSFLSE